jgi:hypothetical protein
MMKGYHPIMHTNLFGSYRVPLWAADDDYEVSVGENNSRMFSNETLPDRIKTALSMINAYPTRDYADWEINPVNVYINHQTPELDEVGWRINRGMYMLVLDNKFLGDITNGRYTRGEGKEEGKGNP